jgi:hypothetical protein
VSKEQVEVNVIVKADTTDLQKAEREADRVMSKMERIISFVKTNSNKLLRTMQSFVSFFSSILKAAGITLGAVGEALLSTISVVLMSVIQMQSILAAGTGGLSLIFGAAMVGVAIAISVIGTMEVMRGMDRIHGELSAAQAAAQSAISMFNIWT